jgi:hypothetical protein
MSLGYFGEVTQEELFTPRDMVNLVGTPVTPNTSTSGVWLKFLLNGRVLYVPKFHVATTGVSWNSLYAAGLVYGARGPGPLPVPPAGAVDQFKLLTKYEISPNGRKLWPLKVQLMRGANDNFIPTNAWASDLSEWDLLWKTFFAKKWESYVFSTINRGYYNYIQERDSGGNYAGLRGYSDDLDAKTRGAASNSTSIFAWRPIVELVRDPNMALEVTKVGYDVSGGMQLLSPVLSTPETNPIKAVINITAKNSLLYTPQVALSTRSEQVWLEPSTGGVSLVATTEGVTEIVPLRHVTLRNSALVVPSYAIQPGKEEIFVSAPGATITLTADSVIENADAKAVFRPMAVRTTQLPIELYQAMTVEGKVYFTNDAQQTLSPPTFTIEDDVI